MQLKIKVQYLCFLTARLKWKKKKCLYFYYKKLYNKRKYCFGVNFFKMHIMMEIHILRSLAYENQIFYHLVWVCLSIISITSKRLIVEPPNFIFCMNIICRCYLKFFYENLTSNLQHTKQFQHITYIHITYIYLTYYISTGGFSC